MTDSPEDPLEILINKPLSTLELARLRQDRHKLELKMAYEKGVSRGFLRGSFLSVLALGVGLGLGLGSRKCDSYDRDPPPASSPSEKSSPTIYL